MIDPAEDPRPRVLTEQSDCHRVSEHRGCSRTQSLFALPARTFLAQMEFFVGTTKRFLARMELLVGTYMEIC
jgi:hypothetical protein